jgi:hypothetical protein
MNITMHQPFVRVYNADRTVLQMAIAKASVNAKIIDANTEQIIRQAQTKVQQAVCAMRLDFSPTYPALWLNTNHGELIIRPFIHGSACGGWTAVAKRTRGMGQATDAWLTLAADTDTWLGVPVVSHDAELMVMAGTIHLRDATAGGLRPADGLYFSPGPPVPVR